MSLHPAWLPLRAKPLGPSADYIGLVSPQIGLVAWLYRAQRGTSGGLILALRTRVAGRPVHGWLGGFPAVDDPPPAARAVVRLVESTVEWHRQFVSVNPGLLGVIMTRPPADLLPHYPDVIAGLLHPPARL